MGMFMGDDDMYIEGLLETLNLRFGTLPDVVDTPVDRLRTEELAMELNVSGIREVRAIQAEFEVFKTGRRLVHSLRALGVGGQWNPVMKRKWFKLLNRLDDEPSSDPPRTGGEAIVAALIDHLQVADPDPVHFKSHDGRQQPGVQIVKNDRPVFYIQRDFLTISLPMVPRPIQATAPAAAPVAGPAPASTPAPAAPAGPPQP